MFHNNKNSRFETKQTNTEVMFRNKISKYNPF